MVGEGLPDRNNVGLQGRNGGFLGRNGEGGLLQKHSRWVSGQEEGEGLPRSSLPNSILFERKRGAGPEGLRGAVHPEPQDGADDQRLEQDGAQEPEAAVLERDQPHEVVGEVAVVPGAGAEVPQQRARGELPRVDACGVERGARGQPAAAPQAQ
ncbi:Myristoylated alanine-rich C-kinase substrate, partial [Ophiophagus hannah]